MSVPRNLRNAVPVEGHGYEATLADWLDTRSLGRHEARYMQKWCGDCQAHNRWRARLSRMRTAYGRRTR